MRTWGEFKRQVEALGVEDGHAIAWIDVNDPYPDVRVEVGNDNSLRISDAGEPPEVDDPDDPAEADIA